MHSVVCTIPLSKSGRPHHGVVDIRNVEKHPEVHQSFVVVVRHRRRSSQCLSSYTLSACPRQTSTRCVEQFTREIEPRCGTSSAAAGCVLVQGRLDRTDMVDIPTMSDHSREDSLVHVSPVRRRVGRHTGTVVIQSARTMPSRRCSVVFDREVQRGGVRRRDMLPAGVADVDC